MGKKERGGRGKYSGSKKPIVLDHHAAIHHHLQSGLLRFARRFPIAGANLHPDDACSNLDRLLDDRGRLLGWAKDLNDVHRLWNGK